MDTANFKKFLLQLLEETFETHYGIYLYKGTSLLETLATITAEEASIPVGGNCPTLAAQVAHTAFYLEVLERSVNGEEVGEVGWEHIWNTVKAATPEDWEASKGHLATVYRRIRTTVESFDSWDENRLEVLAMIVHSAYHLGVIRQSLCVVNAE